MEISGDVNIANESEICKRMDSAESNFSGTSKQCLDKKILLELRYREVFSTQRLF